MLALGGESRRLEGPSSFPGSRHGSSVFSDFVLGKKRDRHLSWCILSLSGKMD